MAPTGTDTPFTLTVRFTGGTGPRYTGRDPGRVPVENEGGGSRDRHWREDVFRHEPMSSAIGGAGNPVGRLTVASLIDLGYQVDLEAAEPYTFPVPVERGARPALRRLDGRAGTSASP